MRRRLDSLAIFLILFLTAGQCLAQSNPGLELSGSDVVWEPVSNKLYVSVPASAPANGEMIAVVDPQPSTIDGYIATFGDPSRIVNAGDGHLYVALANPRKVVRIRVDTRQIDGELRLDGIADPLLGKIADLAVMPGHPGTVAVLLAPLLFEPNWGLIVFRDGVALPKQVLRRDLGRVVFSTDEPDLMYALNTQDTRFGVSRIRITGDGAEIEPGAQGGLSSSFNAQMAYAAGRLFFNNGVAADGRSLDMVGSMEQPGFLFTSHVLIRPEAAKVYLYSQSHGILYVFHMDRYYRMAERQLVPSGIPALWGGGIAVATPNRLYIYKETDIPQLPLLSLEQPRQFADGSIALNLASNAIAYDPRSRRLFASTSDSLRNLSNSVVPLDASTLQPGEPIYAGSRTLGLSVSEESRSLWVGLAGQSAIRRIDIDALTAAELIPMGKYNTVSDQLAPSPSFAFKLHGLPGPEPSVLVVRSNDTVFGDSTHIAVYDLTGPRPRFLKGSLSGNSITADAAGTRAYTSVTQITSGALSELAVSKDGVELLRTYFQQVGFGSRVTWNGGRLYLPSFGQVVDAGTGNLQGLYERSSAIAPDAEHGRFFAVFERRVTAYDLATFVPIGSYELPEFFDTLLDAYVIDSQSLAVRAGGEIRIIPLANIVQPLQPAPDGGTIRSRGFQPGVTATLTAARDIVYDAGRQRLLATFSGVDPAAGNRIAVLDPATLRWEKSLLLGSEPDKIQLSADGKSAWVVMAGTNSIARVNPWDGQLLSTTYTGPLWDIAAAPKNPDLLALSDGTRLRLWNGATQTTWTPPNSVDSVQMITFGDADDELYVYENYADSFFVYRLALEPEVRIVQRERALLAGFDDYLYYKGGLLMAFAGPMVVGKTFEPWGTPGTIGRKHIDLTTNRLYTVRRENFPAETVIRVHELSTLRLLATATLKGVGAASVRITVCGSGVVCLLTADGVIYRIAPDGFTWHNYLSHDVRDEAVGIRSMALPARDLLYDGSRGRLYATVSGMHGISGNSLLTIDVGQSAVTSNIWVGSQPNHMAISKDASRLYVTLDAGLVQPLDAGALSLLPRFSVGTNSSGYSVPTDVAVIPDAPASVVVARADEVLTAPGRDAVLFDGGVPRPKTSREPHPRDVGCNEIEITESWTVLCYNNDDLRSIAFLEVRPDGLHQTANVPAGITGHYPSMRYAGGRAYFSDGTILDIATKSPGGRVSLPSIILGGNSSHAVLPLPSQNRIYYLTGANRKMQISAFELDSLRPLGSVEIPGLDGPSTILTECGADCLAVAGISRVYFVSRNLIDAPPPIEIEVTGDNLRKMRLATSDLAWDSVHGRLLAAIPGKQGALGNSVGIIDPEGAKLERTLPAGSDPSRVIASADGSTAYVWNQGQSALCEYPMGGGPQLRCLDLGRQPNGSPRILTSMAAVPESGRSMVAATDRSVHWFNANGEVAQLAEGMNWVQPAPGAGRIYAAGPESLGGRYLRVDITGGRLRLVSSSSLPSEGSYPFQIVHLDGLIYTNSGHVFHAETLKAAGQYKMPVDRVPQGVLIAINPERDHVYILSPSPAKIFVFDRQTFALLGQTDIEDTGTLSSLTVCGHDCLAWRSPGFLYLLRVSSLGLQDPPTTIPSPTLPSFVNGVMRLDINATALAWDPARNQVWLGTGFWGGLWANSIFPIDWESGQEGDPVPLPNEPTKLAISNDGTYAYASYGFNHGIQRVALADRRPDLQFSYADPNFSGLGLRDTPSDLFVLHDQPGALAIAGAVRAQPGGVAIFDGATRRSDFIGDPYHCKQFVPGATGTLYCTNDGTPSYLRKLDVDANGVRLSGTHWPWTTSFLMRTVYDPVARLVYGGDGTILDPETGEQKGTLPATGWAVLDPHQNTIAYLGFPSLGAYRLQLIVIDLSTRQIKRSFSVETSDTYTSMELVNAGPGRFAARSGRHVFLFDMAP